MWYLIGGFVLLGFGIPLAIVAWSWAVDKALDVYYDWVDD